MTNRMSELANKIYEQHIIEDVGLENSYRQQLPLLSLEERVALLEEVVTLSNPIDELDEAEQHRFDTVTGLLGKETLHHASVDYYLNAETDKKTTQYIGDKETNKLRDLK